MVTSTQFKKRLAKRPFVPFRVVTNTGKRYDVRSPEFILMAKRMFAVGTLRNDGDNEMDCIHVMPIIAVHALEPLEYPRLKK